MSFNQSRSDKGDAQYQKTGRSAGFSQQRSSSGSFPKAGGSGPAPSSALSSSSNRSYKKPNNVQGGKSRVNVPAANSPSDFGGGGGGPLRSVQIDPHVQPQLHGVSDAPAASPAAKPTDSSATQRSARGAPKVSSSQSATMSSETKAPTQSKGDASKSFTFQFQFSSVSPGFMNEMQEHSRDAHNVITSTLTTIQVTIKSAAGAIGEKVVDSSLSNNSPAAERGESQKVSGPLGEASSSHRDTENSESSLQHFKPGSEPFPSNASNPLKSTSTAPSEESVSVVINAEGGNKESVSRLTSIKDHQKKLGKKRHTQPQHQYEAGKATDEEQAKQRQLKSILDKLRQLKSINKLTPQKLFKQVKAVNIDNATTLTGFISQIFDKALMEPTFCEMYANFCYHLAGELPDFSEDNEKIAFKRLLLNKCQEEFERGEREQEVNKVDEEGEVKPSEEEREEKRMKARRRMLGNIRLIGELYKKRMLTERIMHECIKKLLGQYQNPDEEDVEALCVLMSTIGEMIDHPIAKEHIDAYFDMMAKLSNNMKLSSRVRFMLKDSIDLRKNKWQQKSKVEGPKKIEELHRDAGQEQQAQARGLARGLGVNPSRRRATMEFGPRGATMLSSPNAQMGSFRGLSIQARGYGAQDVRTEDRQSYEAKTLSVPLPQKPIGEDSITLGPQGGLARGASIRGPPAMPSAPLVDVSPSPGDNRRMMPGLNGYSSVSERTTYGQREDLIPRYIPDRFASPFAYESSAQECNVNYCYRDHRNPDRGFDRLHASPASRGQVPSFTQILPLEKAWPEERLREMSMAAIKEFYSARDEKEVALCIQDLHSPSFYPSMISLWVTDSFERKDMERDLLAKLLVNLTKSQDGTLSQGQLIKGFESVLTTLEDAINDAPKAPEYLARILARVILENLIPLREIGLLIYEGGDEPGHLREIGIAADILGSILETIKSEKGETVLDEMRTSSSLSLESFQPPNAIRSRKLDIFIMDILSV